MASFFKRLFSSSYRQACAAEAEGRLEEAASLYAQAGETAAVCRVHRMRAQGERDAWKRIELLRLARELARDEEAVDDAERGRIGAALAAALTNWVDEAGVTDRQDRNLLEEAAELYKEAGEFERAGDIFARIGFHNRASEAYTAAGAVSKLEDLWNAEEVEQSATRRESTLLDEFRFAESHGRFLEALQAIRRALQHNRTDPSLLDLHQRFMRRIPRAPRVHVKVKGADGAVVFISGDALTLGRDEGADLPVLAPGVSRLHSQLSRAGDGVIIEDLGSKNGTFVDDEPALPSRPLSERGRLALGERCDLDYLVLGEGCVALRPAVARARNTLYIWGEGWVSGAPQSPLPEGLRFACIDGYWHLHGPPGTTYDGEPHSGEVMLRLETTVVIGAVTLRIA